MIKDILIVVGALILVILYFRFLFTFLGKSLAQEINKIQEERGY